MDPIMQEAIEIGAELLKKTVESAVEGATGWWRDKSKERDFFGNITRKYAEKLIERHNYVKVLGMREPVPLKSLFVRVNILEKISSRLRLSPEELEEFYEQDKRIYSKKQETLDGEAAIDKLQRFIVLGKPGAGKTTYLKYLTLAMLDKKSAIQDKRFPIFITLKEWADSQLALMAFVVKELDICGIPKGADFIERLLEKGKCLVLFDGLDEVGKETNQDQIIQQIIDLSDRYSDNKFVISCRVAAYNHWFQRFTDVEIADFNDQQIKKFIQNWFKKEPKTGKACWEELNKHKNLKELASTPLLLTLLCITYDDNNRFPENRADLYEEAIDALLTKWDSTRRIKRDEIYKSLSLSRKRLLFSKIAARTFEDNRYFIEQKKLEIYIRGIIEHFPGFEEEARLDLDAAAILQGIEAQHGIFVQRAKGIYSFSHLTFQEYFAARNIVENQHKESLEQALIPHLMDERWKEVFLLTAGMLDEADDLLYAIQRQQKARIRENPILATLLSDTSSALEHTFSNYSILERKLVALYLVLFVSFARDRALDLDLARDLARDLALAHDLDLALALDLALDLDLARARALALPRARALARDLALNYYTIEQSAAAISTIDEKDIAVIRSFLATNIFLVNCMKVARFVHKSTRQSILDNLLAAPSG